MLNKLFNRLKDDGRRRAGAGLDLQTAVCALLIEAANTDQSYTDKERNLIERSMAARFNLSPEQAADLRRDAEERQQSAVDVHRFTKIAKKMDHAGKEMLVGELWRVVLSDGVRDPHEEALIRQVCGLIYFDDIDSGRIRQRIETELAGAGADGPLARS